MRASRDIYYRRHFTPPILDNTLSIIQFFQKSSFFSLLRVITINTTHLSFKGVREPWLLNHGYLTLILRSCTRLSVCCTKLTANQKSVFCVNLKYRTLAGLTKAWLLGYAHLTLKNAKKGKTYQMVGIKMR